MDLANLQNNGILIASLLWTLPWKGFALWKAAKMGHKVWFIVLLVVNTFALLEILYIFYFSKHTDIFTNLAKRLNPKKS